eukprot:Nitzschia sp. Nitz4//scaffold273_size25297//1398//4964//NITZ4_008313-RA/size25297-processed-gene-0.16-mRNA-1//1//CDS//3329545238//4168//frame0
MLPNNEQPDEASSSGSDHTSSKFSLDTPPSTYNKEEQPAIAANENTAVHKIRVTVAVFLLFCTIGTAIVVFLNTRQQEQEEFEEEFHDFSSRVFGALASSFDQTFAATDAFAVSLVSYTNAANLTWPFVMLPNGGTRMVKLINVARAAGITFLPYVSAENLFAWNMFSMTNAHAWIGEHLAIQQSFTGSIPGNLSEYANAPIYNGDGSLASGQEYYFPVWQTYPLLAPDFVVYNFDYTSEDSDVYLPGSGKRVTNVLRQGFAELSDVINAQAGSYVDEFNETDHGFEPLSEIHYPIFDNAAESVLIQTTAGGNQSQMLGFILLSFYWRDIMVDLLPSGVEGLVIVISTSNNNAFSYQLNGPDVVFLGFGDNHETKYNDYSLETSLRGLGEYKSGGIVYTGLYLSEELSKYTFRLYPSTTFESQYTSANPWIYTAVAVTIFLFTTAVFIVYDWLVERRQKTVMNTEYCRLTKHGVQCAAVKSSAIVSSLFPKNVRTRLLDMSEKESQAKHSTQKSRLKNFMADISGGMDDIGGSTKSKQNGMTFDSQPIADLFPSATVMFADIVNFTAWSSTREPSQVFILLESVYGSFDKLAAKRGVFKVETIGDCYVAVAGLPDPRRDHAAVMAKFAQDCHNHMRKLVSKLSVTLGPETETMTMRFGLNSGPVTAGVLRGQKSRFQLFGDTVNTASRMESTGKKDCIQASPSTADALRQMGKGHWLKPRSDVVEIKGKGQMSTFWVEPNEKENSTSERQEFEHHGKIAGKHENLVKWNVDVLSKLLVAVLARRNMYGESGKSEAQAPTFPLVGNNIPIDEVQEIIELPPYEAKLEESTEKKEDLNPIVMSQLHNFVTEIAMTYHDDNPFHNFAHASHVCMSVSKLMSRIIAAESFIDEKCAGVVSHKSKHEHTFGIVSDPLTLFACAFAALIHDADHPGVPNMQLVKEGTEFAKKYNERSVAEQRSVEVAWDLLMAEQFKELRDAICGTEEELVRFRELVVNSVMATDIMDKELIGLRNQRWEKAFDVNKNADTSVDNMNRKATIVIEHLIQASDVAHTMQHWHVYRTWNQRLFAEMYRAFKNGRSEKNPVDNWYKGELGFFDFYIIPLAKKLSDCGVFGVSSDEYLNYAIKNREEWEVKGKSIVAEMYQELEEQYS